jgi:phosphoserine aminotransferase
MEELAVGRKFNFYAGPATLPLEVLERMQEQYVDYKGAGLSLVETSHRSKEYDEVHMGAMEMVRELLSVPESHKVLFIQGGATMQFSMIPLNLIYPDGQCDFTLTGAWARKAYADASALGRVNVVWDGSDEKFTRMPKPGEITTSPDSAYLHVTSNETIGGIQYHEWPDTDLPLVADMSSDIMSRRLPMEKFGIIYAGAQKNLGPAGVTLVIMREDVLERCTWEKTAYWNYKIHAKKDSLYNTPPSFAIWALNSVLTWVTEKGGLDAMEKLADTRANKIYGVIAELGDFYRCPVEEASRSKMNIVFRLPTEDLEKQFVAEALTEGMIGLKGHRSVGGCRASVYNSMPVEGAETLASFMREFALKNG